MPAPLSLLISRASCIVVCVAAFIGAVVFTCRQNLPTVLAVISYDGFFTLLWMLGAAALGHVFLRACGVRANALLAVSSSAGIGLGLFGLAGLVLGLAGALNRPVALAMPIGSVVLWIADRSRQLRAFRTRSDLGPVKQWLAAPAGFGWVWVVPVISLAIVCVSASILPGVLWKPFDPAPYDVTSYHLQVPREWFEAGRIVPLRHNMFSYFPFGVEMQFLLLMHVMGSPWAAMYSCQLLCAGYAALMVLAVAGAAAGQGEAKTGAAVIGAAVAAVVPWLLVLAGVGYVESALMLYTALAIAWAMRAVGSTAFVRYMILAGGMAGLAAGVKITAVPMLLLSVPAIVFVVLMVRRPTDMPVRRVLLGCGGCVLVGMLMLSPWLIRTWAWTGNPVWPLAMKTLGRDHFSPGQVERFVTAHSPRPDQRPATARLGVLWVDVLGHWQYGYLLLPAGLLAAGFRLKDRQTWLLLLTAGTVLVVWIGFTHLLARFLVMLIPLAGILIGRLRWGRAWPAGVAMVLAAAGLGWWHYVPLLMEQSAVPADRALVGIVDLSAFLSNELTDAKAKNMQVGMVGDAQAFLYQIPMTELHYKTVFDLPADTDDAVTAWAGPGARGNPDYWFEVNSSEIDRLHRTYLHVPPVPKAWRSRLPETFFVRGGAAGK